MIRRILHYSDQLAELDNEKNLEPYWKRKRFTRLIQNFCEIYVCESMTIDAYVVVDPHGNIERYCGKQLEYISHLIKFLKHEKPRLQVELEDSNNHLNAHHLFSRLGFIGKLTQETITFTWTKKNAPVR